MLDLLLVLGAVVVLVMALALAAAAGILVERHKPERLTMDDKKSDPLLALWIATALAIIAIVMLSAASFDC
jgi:hypothetical protein